MNRRYTTEEFKKVVTLLRDTYSDVILTTDIIVGFPGETEYEFDETYKFLKEVKFYKMHIFKYSRRKGTKADSMENQIEPDVQEQRSKKLLELSDNHQKEYNEKFIGKTVEVLFEEQDGVYIKGHTDNYLVIKVEGEKINKYHNEIKKVEIINRTKEDLIGKM